MTLMLPTETTRGRLAAGFRRSDGARVEWRIADEPVAYDDAVRRMEARAAAIADGEEAEEVWLVEHPPLFTAGTGAAASDLLWPDRFPVHRTGRGGQYTYHGPGQRVAYTMLNLAERRQDLRAFIAALEEWIISALAEFGLTAERREDRVGVWIVRPEKPPLPGGAPAEDKIAAIGIRVRRWVSFHGIAINVEPDLSHYGGIVPCGISGHGVTSLVDLGLPVVMADLDIALKRAFVSVFGDVVEVGRA